MNNWRKIFSWEEPINQFNESYLIGKLSIHVGGDRLGNMPSDEEEMMIDYDPNTKIYDTYLGMADESFKANSIEELIRNVKTFLKTGWQVVKIRFIKVKRTPRSLKLSSIDENTDLSEATDSDYLEIQISSVKDNNGFNPKGEGRGYYPVSTVAKYRFKDGSKWEFIGDYDSGEQQGIATDIPEGVKKLLLAFGLTERPRTASLSLNAFKKRDTDVTETYTFVGPKDTMERFKRFLAFFAHNGGHSGTFGMSFDGDGSDYLHITPEIPRYDGMDDVAGRDVELASNDGYYGLKIERDIDGRQKEASLKLSWEEKPSPKEVVALVEGLQQVWDQLGSDILDGYESSGDRRDKMLVRNGLPGNIVYECIADYVTSNWQDTGQQDLVNIWQNLTYNERQEIAKIAFPPKQRYGR
jgi:hypothetical protein